MRASFEIKGNNCELDILRVRQEKLVHMGEILICMHGNQSFSTAGIYNFTTIAVNLAIWLANINLPW